MLMDAIPSATQMLELEDFLLAWMPRLHRRNGGLGRFGCGVIVAHDPVHQTEQFQSIGVFESLDQG